MAAHPIVVVDDELLQKLPREFQGDPRYQKGASLELVPVSAAAGAWRTVGGMAAGIQGDPNAALEEEKQRELAEQRRWQDA